jgi:hypothetical protein
MYDDVTLCWSRLLACTSTDPIIRLHIIGSYYKRIIIVNIIIVYIIIINIILIIGNIIIINIVYFIIINIILIIVNIIIIIIIINILLLRKGAWLLTRV